MSHDDKPFACSATDCGMRFSTEDHLNVHLRKHEMSLALNLGGSTISSPSNPFLDQTPTPTKFLKNCEEIGLFQELSKNPFEEAFKKASDVPEGPLVSVPLPGPHSNELNTPVPLDNLKNELVKCLSAKLIKQEPLSGGVVTTSAIDKALDLSGHRTSPVKTVAVQPSSTTNDDENECVSMSQAADSTVSPARNVVSSTGPEIIAQPVSVATQLVTSPAIIVPQVGHHQPVTSPATTAVTVAVAAATPTTQSYAMQVFLQLPTGQTVPVHIPATLNPVAISGMQQMVTMTSASPVTTSPVTTMNLKQRLKQSLAASQQQNSQRTVGVVSSVVQASPIADAQNHILVNSQASTPTILSEVMSPNSDSPTSVDLDFAESLYRKRSKSGNEDEADDRRRKFLERNRAAAARCRMKRKSWISNLERKADDLQNTNTRLQTEVNVLRSEVAQLKTLLLAHKDCPITLQQKSQSQGQITVMLDSGVTPSVLTLPISEPSQVVTATHMVAATSSNMTVIPLDSDNLLLTQGRSKK
ncbi:cyclic AMP-dependent transcription factor ATF-2-like [Gigantopelta aegis]|uniref:cyclic AMP-dependent transcription factor ATF-2-like n=1 Tax=Gigantopelta aegis TaxID=1735272 RepID=UPI001B88A22D|nr:cyclic AMP-dependent transcription factor ATF-2-like [Gigantopelta aegis]